jgi:hypothetical protein
VPPAPAAGAAGRQTGLQHQHRRRTGTLAALPGLEPRLTGQLCLEFVERGGIQSFAPARTHPTRQHWTISRSPFDDDDADVDDQLTGRLFPQFSIHV